jgi:hypothetical protein
VGGGFLCGCLRLGVSTAVTVAALHSPHRTVCAPLPRSLCRVQLNYGWERAQRKMACYCGAPRCAGFLGVRSDEALSSAAIPSGRWVAPSPVQRESGEEEG